MIKLYYAPRTRAVRVVWLLEELGLPYELVRVPFQPPATKSPSPTGIFSSMSKSSHAATPTPRSSPQRYRDGADWEHLTQPPRARARRLLIENAAELAGCAPSSCPARTCSPSAGSPLLELLRRLKFRPETLANACLPPFGFPVVWRTWADRFRQGRGSRTLTLSPLRER